MPVQIVIQEKLSKFRDKTVQKSVIPHVSFLVFSCPGSRGSQWVKGGVRGVPGRKGGVSGVSGGKGGVKGDVKGDIRGVFGGQGVRQGCPKGPRWTTRGPRGHGGAWKVSQRINTHI